MSERSFICVGHPPLPGCGRVLTVEERVYYSGACETCERAWSEAIRDWRHRASAEHAEFFKRQFDARETRQ